MKRIQRKRTRGFRMPEGVIYVGRGSRFGNPFKLIDNEIYYQWKGEWFHYHYGKYATTEDVVKLFRDLLFDLNSHPVELEIYERFRWMRDHIRDLQGRDLACWCKKGCDCHADSLMELANPTDWESANQWENPSHPFS